MELRIEKLKRRDLRHLLPIEAAVFPEPWSVGVFNSELALRHGRLYRAAWHNDDMAGYIGFMIVDEEAHVTLLIDGIHTLLPMGVRHLSLEVAASNEGAQTLYRRFGFAPVGVRKNYYPITGEDALVMWAYDIDTPDYAQRLEGLDPSRS
jgi:ribosomal-protein-alanine N-acetyltransferase